jgi:proline dehydrogenase
MLELFSKAAFSVLASSGSVKKLASRYGMRGANGFARRFIAGESIDDVIAVARHLEASGLGITLDYLGESVSSHGEAAEATKAYVGILEQVERAGVGRNLSIKLSQLGIDVDRATSIDNVRRVLNAASTGDAFVRIDMERSNHTDLTLDIFETLWNLGYRQAGVVIQSYLRRSAADLERMISLGARVRLVKGAYKEGRSVAFQQKTEVDASYIDLMKRLLAAGTYPAIATHDPAMITATRTFAQLHGIPKTGYEFQMLYGIRRDLQTQLASEGHPVRVYVPFGRQWFPYFMRRLGERPANVGFVVRSLMNERGVRPGSDPADGV